MMAFSFIPDSKNLPSQWDENAEEYFQKSDFLLHTEMFNPCSQRYYTCFEDQKMLAGAIVYTLQLDLLTFVKIRSPLKMHIVGIPCSVSSPGIFGDPEAIESLKHYISIQERGLVLFLNLKNPSVNHSFAQGKTLPTIVLRNRFANWDDYMSSLRSSYRRRLNHILKENEDLHYQRLECSEFTEEMYNQYLEVYKRSSGKLEKLTFPFFKNLPSEFILTTCSKEKRIIGWNIALRTSRIYYFFLGGIDYEMNNIYHTYFRLLSLILRDGIQCKAEWIELGQTAETPKMRVGGLPEVRYMEAHHSNKFLNRLLRFASPLLEYRHRIKKTNALKEDSQ